MTDKKNGGLKEKIKDRRAVLLFVVYVVAVFCLAEVIYLVCQDGCLDVGAGHPLDLNLEQYQDSYMTSTWQQLTHRVHVQPFNLVALILFFCAVVHTFFAHKINVISHRLREKNVSEGKEVVDSFTVEILGFLGEIEVIFGIWVIPLMIAMTFFYNWHTAVTYLEGRSYTEPLFVVVIMTLAATRPILRIAEQWLRFFAEMGGGTVQSWWWTILTIGPLSGSLITEPGAMTISALLLSKQVYQLKPSKKMAYATLGLLFVNISVGGVFTNFAAPPVLMVALKWHWSTPYMFLHFGLKALVGILIANTTYYMMFRKEFKELEEKKRLLRGAGLDDSSREKPIPFWISLTHLAFLAWTVVHVHHPVIFLGSFLLFIGFHRATLPHQRSFELKTPVLVGFFLAGLVVHGSLQAWWIAPVLGNATKESLMVFSMVLTAFNDNAAITFLASLIPNFDESMKYAVMSGAVAGGGLTVIANAPNPSGQAILNKHFDQGVSMVDLLRGALTPTIIMGVVFYLLRMF